MHCATSRQKIMPAPQHKKQTAQTLDDCALAISCANVEIPEGDSMLEKTFADHFAAGWIAAWNNHDLDRVLSHYADDFEMSSPYIAQLAGEPSGKLKGKKAIGAYWTSALKLIPDLRFELISTLVGVNSITLYYKGHRGMAAEVFIFGPDKKVSAAFAHYAV
jgi:SnoaL-like protein